MSSKRTTSVKKKAPKAKAKASTAKKGPKADQKDQGPRHPRGRVTKDGGKEALAKALAPALVRGDESADDLTGRLKTASNTQLLRLQKVVKIVKDKWGTREKLIQSILEGGKQTKDKDFVTKLSSFSLPKLVDIATSAARR